MTDTPPDTRDGLEAWRISVVAWHQLFTALDRQLMRDLGIPHAHYMILLGLLRSENSAVSLTALARDLGYSPSRLSHAVTRLEQLQWVERSVSPTDRRVSILTLRAEGRDAIRRATPAHFAEIDRIFVAPLSQSDQDDARRIAMKLIDNLATSDPTVEHIRASFLRSSRNQSTMAAQDAETDSAVGA